MQFDSAKQKKKKKKKIKCGSTKRNDISLKGRGGIRKSRFCEGCQRMVVKVDTEIR